VDSSEDTDNATDTGPDPIEESETRRDQQYVETLVHVVGLPCRVVAIDVDQDSAVAVDASTEEICESVVRYCERPDGTALGRREPNADEPIVESAITPLNFVMDSVGVAICAIGASR